MVLENGQKVAFYDGNSKPHLGRVIGIVLATSSDYAYIISVEEAPKKNQPPRCVLLQLSEIHLPTDNSIVVDFATKQVLKS